MALASLKDRLARAFGHDPEQSAAVDLYSRIVEQARTPAFYVEYGAAYGVPDTVEGRYDLLTLHMFLVLRRLRREAETTKPFAQKLFDVMFRNMDDSLREMGVGDLKVGAKVRGLAEDFYGRLGAYERALEGEGSLEEALGRNVFGEEGAAGARPLAAYVRRAERELAAQGTEGLRRGVVRFPDPGETASETKETHE